MKLRYSRPDLTYPELRRARPHVSEEDRRLAQLARPPALPIHCKPWLDAQSYGVLMSFPYQASVTMIGREEGVPSIDLKSFTNRRVDRRIISMFSHGYLGLATGYRIRTSPGVGIYTCPVDPVGRTNFRVVRGLIETWWYPKEIFLVFESPMPGEVISLSYEDPLSVLIPVLCEECRVIEMDAKEKEMMAEEEKIYRSYLDHRPELRWTSAEGHGFSRIYKVFSKRLKAGLKLVDNHLGENA